MSTFIRSVDKQSKLSFSSLDEGRREVLVSPAGQRSVGVTLQEGAWGEFVGVLGKVLRGEKVEVGESEVLESLAPVRVVEEEGGAVSVEITSGVSTRGDVILSTLAFVLVDGRVEVLSWWGSSRGIAQLAEGAEGETVEAGEFRSAGVFASGLLLNVLGD